MPMIFEDALKIAQRSLADEARLLLEDIEDILAGKAPQGGDLAEAPLLDHWRPLISGKIIALAGFVKAHPLRRDGLVVTSMLCAIDAKTFTWARTQGRWYRLGRHFGAFEIRRRTSG